MPATTVVKPALPVKDLELSIEGLLKLLGGTPAQRERFFEIVKGITTPAEYTLAKSAIVTATQELKTVQATLAATKSAATQARG